MGGTDVHIKTPDEGTEGYWANSGSGEITILKSTPKRVAGTFTIDVYGKKFTPNGTQTLSGTYSGEFIAVPK